jgi:hypothetical protein
LVGKKAVFLFLKEKENHPITGIGKIDERPAALS